MLRRYSIYLLLPLLCTALSITSGTLYPVLYYGAKEQTFTLAMSEGGVYFEHQYEPFMKELGYPSGWSLYSSTLIHRQPNWRHLGFDLKFYSLPKSGLHPSVYYGSYIMIPFWFPLLLSFLPLLRAYQKSRRTPASFPLEPSPPPQQKI